ncbi:sel1 repeat family protein [Jhaorihella thermophila]
MLIRTAALILAAAPALADEDEFGTLNPEEMTLDRVMRNIRDGQPDMMSCAAGYYITKSGRHGMAREVFETCANAGWTGAMTWMSQLDNNGLGGDYDPDAAAQWGPPRGRGRRPGGQVQTRARPDARSRRGAQRNARAGLCGRGRPRRTGDRPEAATGGL